MNVPEIQLRKLLISKSDVEPITTAYSAFKVRNQSAIMALDSIPESENYIRILPHKIYCNNFIPNRYITQLESKVLYYDDNHLTNEGAKLIVTEAMKFVK